jgi:hypothetical protein
VDVWTLSSGRHNFRPAFTEREKATDGHDRNSQSAPGRSPGSARYRDPEAGEVVGQTALAAGGGLALEPVHR